MISYINKEVTFMDENKTMSLAVLGVVAVIAVVSVVLLLTNAQTSGLTVVSADKTYGGDGRYPGRFYDVNANRLVDGNVEGVGTERAAAGGIPYRTYNRAASENPSLLTSCGPQWDTMDFNKAEDRQYRYGVKCFKTNSAPDGHWCCPKVNLAKGVVID